MRRVALVDGLIGVCSQDGHVLAPVLREQETWFFWCIPHGEYHAAQ